MARGLQDVRDKMLEEKSRLGGSCKGEEYGDSVDQGVEGFGGCVNTPQSDTSFF